MIKALKSPYSKSCIALWVMVSLFLAGCGAENPENQSSNNNSASTSTSSGSIETGQATNASSSSNSTSSSGGISSSGNYLSSSSNSSTSSSGFVTCSTTPTGQTPAAIKKPEYTYSHAPSLTWIEAAGWTRSTAPYESNDASDLRVGTNDNIATGMQSETPITHDITHVSAINRGNIYQISADIRAADVDSIIDVQFVLHDIFVEYFGDTRTDGGHFTYPLIEVNQIGSEWVTVTGEYEMWGSSGQYLHIDSEFGDFMHRNVRIDEVGEGSLTGNSVIPRVQEKMALQQVSNIERYLDSGWQIFTPLTIEQYSARNTYYMFPFLMGTDITPETVTRCDVEPYDLVKLELTDMVPRADYEVTITIAINASDLKTVSMLAVGTEVSLGTNEDMYYSFELDNKTLEQDSSIELTGQFNSEEFDQLSIQIDSKGAEFQIKDVRLTEVN